MPSNAEARTPRVVARGGRHLEAVHALIAACERRMAGGLPALRGSTRADVPVALACVDDAGKRVGVDSAWRLGGEPAADMASIPGRDAGRAARRPQDAAPVRLP